MANAVSAEGADHRKTPMPHFAFDSPANLGNPDSGAGYVNSFGKGQLSATQLLVFRRKPMKKSELLRAIQAEIGLCSAKIPYARVPRPGIELKSRRLLPTTAAWHAPSP